MRAYVYTALSGGAQLASIAFYLLLARTVTPATYGDVVANLNIALIAAGVLSLGSNMYIVREVSAGRLSPGDLISRILGRLVYSVLVATLLSIALIVGGPGGEAAMAVGCGLLVFLAHASQLLTTIPLARGRLVVAGIGLVIDKAVSAVVLLCVASLGALDSSYVPLIAALGPLAALFFVSAWAIRQFLQLTGRERGKFGNLLSMITRISLVNPWRGSGRIGISYVCFALQPADVAVVRASAGPEVAGEYAAVSRWIQPTALLASSLGQAVLPRLSNAGSTRVAVSLLSRLWPALVLVVGLATIGALFSSELVSVVLGPAYAESGLALAILMLASPVAFVSQLIYVLLTARGLEGPCARVVLISTLAAAPAYGLLSVSWGALGAAGAFLSTQLILLLGFLVILGSELRVDGWRR